MQGILQFKTIFTKGLEVEHFGKLVLRPFGSSAQVNRYFRLLGGES